MTTIFHFTIDCDWIPNSEKSLPRLFDIIDKFKIKPTFFLTGKFVEDNKEFVCEMKIRNYEIGCHGLNHGLDSSENFGNMRSYSDQRRILSNATEIIYKTIGINPKIFRAPRLEISDNTFKLLSNLNYEIDSSIPVRRFDFGFGCVNNLKHIHNKYTPFYINKTILEIPPSAFILPLNMRLIRLFGVYFAHKIMKMIKSISNIIVFYLHPSEFVPISELKYPLDEEYFYKTCGTHNYIKLESFLTKVFDEKVQSERMSIHLKK